MNQNLTDITIVLDRSGSMNAIRTDAIGGINAFLEEQKGQPGDALLSLIQFDDRYEPNYQGVPVRDAEPLTYETFVPRGMTALFDAMGRSIVEAGARFAAMAEADRPGKVVFVIMTDGEENASREYDAAAVKRLVELQSEAYSWQFLYLGANQDAIKAAAKMGVMGAHAATYTAANFAGVARMSSRKVAAFRGAMGESASAAMDFTPEERREAIDPDPEAKKD